MNDLNNLIEDARRSIESELEGSENPVAALKKSKTLKGLYAQIPSLEANQKAAFGQAINGLKSEIEERLQARSSKLESREDKDPIDLTAPWGANTAETSRPRLLPATQGSIHPLSSELEKVIDIFVRMGFEAVESRQLDDDYHVFETLNFPADHPAKDDYDTFMTEENLIPPPHTSTMQNRLLKSRRADLEKGEPIQVVIPGRVFRNEDLDARHEHTFHQVEGIYVNQGVTVGNLIATLQTFLESYYQQELEVKTQPFYFPFTEPSFEFALSCPFCKKQGCKVCSQEGWIELLGCGMINPNVLKMAGINPNKYTGFAWGMGVERLVMMKYGIEDIRHFNSGQLSFLSQFREAARR